MKTFVRALRLPFVTASVLPFLFGSSIAPGAFSWILCLVGVVAVAAAHLGANLINDYADSKSGADWHDRRAYGFFGGSKLIQDGVLTEQFYLRGALVFFALALAATVMLSILTGRALILWAAVFICVLAWSYSTKPFALAYHRLGEIAIFILFGPAVVMGGYYLQSGIFFDVPSVLFSLPFGFLTTAILYANEIPDAPTDRASGKNTWASILPVAEAYWIYVALMVLAFASLLVAVLTQGFSLWALTALASIALAVKAARILRAYPTDKLKLIESSKLTIAAQNAVSLILIGSALL